MGNCPAPGGRGGGGEDESREGALVCGAGCPGADCALTRLGKPTNKVKKAHAQKSEMRALENAIKRPIYMIDGKLIRPRSGYRSAGHAYVWDAAILAVKYQRKTPAGCEESRSISTRISAPFLKSIPR